MGGMGLGEGRERPAGHLCPCETELDVWMGYQNDKQSSPASTIFPKEVFIPPFPVGYSDPVSKSV